MHPEISECDNVTPYSEATEEQKAKACFRHLALKLGNYEFQIFEECNNTDQWPQPKAESTRRTSLILSNGPAKAPCTSMRMNS